MKNIKQKSLKILEIVFGYGVMLSLFLGGISFFGYLVALVTGGEIAEKICYFIYKDFYPVLVYASSVLILLGLLKMYLNGETALNAAKKKKLKIDNLNCKIVNFLFGKYL